MHFFAWIIVIGLLILLGSVLKRAWLSSQEQNQQGAEVAETDFATNLSNAVQSQLQSVREGLGNLGIGGNSKAKGDAVAQFRTWSTVAFAKEPQIQSWLTLLSDEQIGALMDHLADFCQDMGFELEWLLQEQVAPHTELAKRLAEIAILYSRASFQAVALQPDVELFRVYHNYVQNPSNRANRELGNQLFSQLVEQGLSGVSVEQHLASSTREREQQILETIQQVAAEKPQALNQALRSVLFGDGMADSMANGMANGMADSAVNSATNGTQPSSVPMNGTTKVTAATG